MRRPGCPNAWRDEAAFRQELALILLLAPLTLWLGLPVLDTVLLMGLEAIVDMASPDIHALGARSKTVAAQRSGCRCSSSGVHGSAWQGPPRGKS
ncbi:MAG: hypothetical protein K2W33_10430 [Burkholderiales bacterium]|nr:hypothetical protein [Burkholderiales bacterium]